MCITSVNLEKSLIELLSMGRSFAYTGVQILDAAGNLLIPCRFGSFVDSGVEALEERAGSSVRSSSGE